MSSSLQSSFQFLACCLGSHRQRRSNFFTPWHTNSRLCQRRRERERARARATMGRDSHLSASASQIYPSASPPPPPRHSASTAHSHSDTFQLNPVSPSSNEDESGHATARRIRVLNFGRLALTVLSIAVAAAVVGCEAHGLNVYNLTRLNDGFFLPPLWPRGLDLRPTQGMVVGGAVAALAGLVYVLVGVVPVVSCCFGFWILL